MSVVTDKPALSSFNDDSISPKSISSISLSHPPNITAISSENVILTTTSKRLTFSFLANFI